MNIHIPTPLRVYTNGAETVAVPGATVAEVFDQLTAQYPELKQQLFNTEGKLRSALNSRKHGLTASTFTASIAPISSVLPVCD